MICKRKTEDLFLNNYANKNEFEKALLDQFNSMFFPHKLKFQEIPIFAINLGERNQNFDFWHALCGYENAKKNLHIYNDIRAGKIILLKDLLSKTCSDCPDFVFYETYHKGKIRDLRLKIMCINEKYLISLRKFKNKLIYITSFGPLSDDQVLDFLKKYNLYKKIKKPI